MCALLDIGSPNYTSFIAQWQKGHLTVVYPRNAPGAKPPVVPFPSWSTPR